MTNSSNVVSIHPYFKPHPGKSDAALALLPKFIAATAPETKNLYYDFSWSGEVIFCREAYVGADGLLEHLKNVSPVLDVFLPLVDVVRCEIHGPAAELEKLKEPLAHLKPVWFTYQTGVSR